MLRPAVLLAVLLATAGDALAQRGNAAPQQDAPARKTGSSATALCCGLLLFGVALATVVISLVRNLSRTRQREAAMPYSSRPSAPRDREPKRPLNRCVDCGHTWHPRGRDRSIKCPACGVDRKPKNPKPKGDPCDDDV